MRYETLGSYLMKHSICRIVQRRLQVAWTTNCLLFSPGEFDNKSTISCHSCAERIADICKNDRRWGLRSFACGEALAGSIQGPGIEGLCFEASIPPRMATVVVRDKSQTISLRGLGLEYGKSDLFVPCHRAHDSCRYHM